jgi:hypothetical protein
MSVVRILPETVVSLIDPSALGVVPGRILEKRVIARRVVF